VGDRRRLMSYFGILLICCKKHPGFLVPVKDIAESMPGATSGFQAVDIVSEDKRTDAFLSAPHDADLGSLFDCMNRVSPPVLASPWPSTFAPEKSRGESDKSSGFLSCPAGGHGACCARASRRSQAS